MKKIKDYINNFYTKDHISKLKKESKFYNKEVLNSLLSIIDNRLFFVLNMTLKYEFNSNWLKDLDSSLNKTFTNKWINKLYKDYECLEIIINNEIEQSINFINIFLSRLENDINEINRYFFKNDKDINIWNIKRFTTELSDRHEDSSTVIIISFKNNKKIIYKPRNLWIDILYSKIMERINSNIKNDILKNVSSLNKESYWWQEFIEEKECTNKKDIETYYVNQWINLALIYLLWWWDFHNENIISHHKYPVLVDLETIIQPWRIKKKVNKDKFENFLDDQIYDMYNNVFKTWMLHFITANWVDNSAFCFDLQEKRDESISCAPLFKWKRIDITWNNKFIINGFNKNFFKIKKIVEDFEDEFNNNQNIEIRYIHRATQNYTDILTGSLHPDNLRKIDKRIKYIRDNLIKDNFNLNSDEIIKHEVKSIWNLNIPKFTTTVNSKSIKIWDNIIVNVLEKTALENIKSSKSTQKDLINNLFLIENSYKLAKANYKIQFNEKSFATKKDINRKDIQKTVKDEITKIYNSLSSDLFQDDDFALLISSNQKWKILEYWSINWELYDWLAGVSLFFWAYHKLFWDQEAEIITKKLFKTAINMEKENTTKWVFSWKLWLAYTWWVLYKLFKDNYYLKETRKILDEEIESKSNTNEIDIISWITWKIIVYIELSKIKWFRFLKNEIEKKISSLISVTETFLKERTVKDITYKQSWFAHWISGIVYALDKYHNEIKNDDKINNIIKKLIKEENNLYIWNFSNWKMSKDKEFSNQKSWCYWSPWILISRIFQKENKYIIDPLENYSTTIDTNWSDCLCHWNIWNLDILIELNKKHMHKYSNKIDDLIIKILSTKKYSKKEWFSWLPWNIESKWLMTWNAWIWYWLLRYLEPDTIPSVLFLNI